MSYEIVNNYTSLKLNLKTSQSNKTALRLYTYINDSNTVFKTYTPTSTDDGVYFTINTSEYTIGDVITKFEIGASGNTYLWQTNEGIKWLVDGEEYTEIDSNNNIIDTFHTNTKTFSFSNNSHHTIEAVFVGNDNLAMSTTGKYDLAIKQPDFDESGSLENDGAYSVDFINPNISTLTYKDGTYIEFILTKGGVPVPDRSFEAVKPDGTETVNNGRGGYTNTSFNCGTYKIGAYYQNPTTHELIASTYKNITIKKGNPTFTDNYQSGTYFTPSLKYKLTLSYMGSPIANAKITLYVNGKATTLTTNSKGVVYYGFKKKGTYKFKAVYKGNSNLNSKEFSRTITVVEVN